MGINKINLDKEVSQIIHYPRVDNVPLYARVPEWNGRGENGKELDENRTEKWKTAVDRMYNSPNNIRRLFIAGDKIHWHLYQPIECKSSPKTSLMVTKEIKVYTSEDILRDKLENRGMGYSVVGTGLGALSSPWVASNIEEVYFDWVVLLSDLIPTLGMGDLFDKLTKNISRRIERSDIPRIIFENAVLNSGETLESKFPRLKVIGYVQQLDQVYNIINYKTGIDSIDDLMNKWCNNPKLKQAARIDANCTVAISIIDNIPTLNTKYRLRDGIYLYDREILGDYFRNLEDRINKHKENERNKDRLKNEPKGELDEILDEIKLKYGTEKLDSILKVLVRSDIKKVELRKGLNELGILSYADYIG